MRHFAGYSRFSQFVFIVLPDLRIFVSVLYQRTASLHVDVNAVLAPFVGNLKADRMNPAAIADRQVTRALGPGIEVLMKPTPWRTIDASLLPLNLYYFLFTAVLVGLDSGLLGPQQNIPRRLQPQQNRSRAVIVSFVVPSRRPLRQMTDQSIAREFELGDAHPSAFDFPVVQSCRLNVHDKIGFPNVLHAGFVALLSDVEKPVGARVAIRKRVGTVEDEFLIMEDVHDQWGVGNSQKLYRLPPTVNQSMPGVERRREEAPWPPLEHLFAAALLPDFRGPLPTQNADYLFIKMFLCFEGAARRNLGNIHSRNPFIAVMIQESRPATQPGPKVHRHFTNVFDAVSI